MTDCKLELFKSDKPCPFFPCFLSGYFNYMNSNETRTEMYNGIVILSQNIESWCVVIFRFSEGHHYGRVSWSYSV